MHYIKTSHTYKSQFEERGLSKYQFLQIWICITMNIKFSLPQFKPKLIWGFDSRNLSVYLTQSFEINQRNEQRFSYPNHISNQKVPHLFPLSGIHDKNKIFRPKRLQINMNFEFGSIDLNKFKFEFPFFIREFKLEFIGWN